MFRYLRQRQLHIFSFAAFGHLATSFDYSHLTILSSCVYYLHCGQDNKAFLYGDVCSNNDLNQLMFIIKNNGLFMWNDAAKQYKQMWWKVTENRLGRVEIGHKNMTYDQTWAKQAMILQQSASVRKSFLLTHLHYSVPKWSTLTLNLAYQALGLRIDRTCLLTM